MAPKIRDFEFPDLGRICEFKRRSMEINFHGCEFKEDIFRNAVMRNYELKPDSIKVAEDDGKIVGYIWLRALSTTTGQFGRIEHIFVDEEHRHKGIGRMLMEVAEGYFRRHGLKRVKLTVTVDNNKAIELYGKLGYTTKRQVMEKDL